VYPSDFKDEKILAALATEAEMNQLFRLGFTVSPTAAGADAQNQALVAAAGNVAAADDISGIADDLNAEALLNGPGT
jgi:ABC-type hemin transport system substrate-binding protein